MTFERNKYKDFATIQLKDRWTVPVLVTLFTTLLLKLFEIPANMMSFSVENLLNAFNNIDSFSTPQELLNSLYSGTNLPGLYLLSILETVVSVILSFAGLKVFIKMSFSKEPVSFKLFIEGLSDWGRAILCYFWEFLWIFLWALTALPLCFIFGVIIAIIGIEDTSIVISVMPLLMIGGLIPAIYKAIRYSMTDLLCVEFPELSIRKAMKISIKITEGHVGNILVTYLSFIGWFMLGAISFGIANLWISPYFSMIMVNVYHALLKGAIEDGKISIDDLKNTPKTEPSPAPQPQAPKVIEAPAPSYTETEQTEANTETTDQTIDQAIEQTTDQNTEAQPSDNIDTSEQGE